MSEYPAEVPALDGTGLTEAICPEGHGKARTVSADALYVKGAPLGTFGLRCLEPLDKKAKKDTGSPIRAGEASANGTNLTSNAPVDPTACQAFLVPLESFDDNGEPVRKNGKLVKKDETRNERETIARGTGGEKLAKAAGTTNPKGAKAAKKGKPEKNTARRGAPKVDSRGGKGVSVKDVED